MKKLGIIYKNFYKLSKCQMIPSFRWAFNTLEWEPSEEEFMLASSCLQTEEKDRIEKFIYKKDVKASLAGRLMIRKFVSENTGLPYNTVKLSRDAYTKPIFVSPSPEIPKVSFNISHHGSFTVLAGEIGSKNIGVDVMKLEYAGGKSLEEFFRLMKRNFSVLEWKRINGVTQSTQHDKIFNFCRNWALKESYVKAIGVGLTINLDKLNFIINSALEEGKVVINTTLYLNNEKQSWVFEESLLDMQHCVVVALEEQHKSSFNLNELNFIKLNSVDLLENVAPLLPMDFKYCSKYFSKE